VEGCFGSGNRKYSLDLIMARLPKGAKSTISMGFVVMCAEKIWRLLRLFFVAILACFCSRQWPRFLWISLRNIWQLEMADSLAAIWPSVWVDIAPIVRSIWIQPADPFFRSP
jgi:hypothetical protein